MPQIDARTRVCALIGHPVGHSLSPPMHNAAFDALGLPFVYVAHDVLPGEVGRALEGIRALGYRGLSVTIPHKVEALRFVDEVDEIARGIGCINTVVNDGGRLRGFNSDGLGALDALRGAGADPAGRRALGLDSGRPLRRHVRQRLDPRLRPARPRSGASAIGPWPRAGIIPHRVEPEFVEAP